MSSILTAACDLISSMKSCIVLRVCRSYLLVTVSGAWPCPETSRFGADLILFLVATASAGASSGVSVGVSSSMGAMMASMDGDMGKRFGRMREQSRLNTLWCDDKISFTLPK